MLGEVRFAHDGHATAFDLLVVLADGEGVHVHVLAQIRDAARADRRILLVIDHVLVDHRVLARSTRAQAVERPCAAVLEQRLVAADQKLADDLVETLLALVVNLAHRARKRALHARRRHERVERGLACSAFDYALDVVDQDVLGLRREVEDHVGVHGHEIRARLLDALHDFLTAAVLFVAIHLLEQPVVEALHADGKAIDATFQLLEIARNKMVRVGLRRHFLDGEVLARHVDRLAQLIDHDGGRATADVDALEIVAQILEHHHLFAHVGEIGFRALLLEREAVERAVRAQALAERDVHIEHVALPRLWRSDLHVVGRRELQILV